METKNIYFISGIDTDAGKSYCTAWYARELMQRGLRVITQKFIQTGNTGHSEDIDLHRRLTGTGYLPEDKEGLTMPEIFSYPCSPHLAARIDKRPIDFGKIERATRELSHRYDTVLVEGAGGLMVPLTEDFLTIDYIAEKQYPLIFVTSGKLGSINHTLLSFEAIKNRDIALDTVLYNLYPTVEDKTIQEDTMKYIKQPDGISYDVYNLEIIIAIAFKICSKESIQFRRFVINEICATKKRNPVTLFVSYDKGSNLWYN